MTLNNETDAPHLFHEGTNYHAYNYMGAHIEKNDCVSFRVWAPNAERVYLVGDFNGWTNSCPMKKITEDGIWEISLSSNSACQRSLYKYKIITPDGKSLYRADPYAKCLPPSPESASLLSFDKGFDWHDIGWLSNRGKTMTGKDALSRPINIYELHPASWKKKADGSLYSYASLARELAPYVKQMGYTHISLLPTSLSNDLRCGICSYYAPESVLGSQEELRELVDIMHTAGIGVILTIAPMQFSDAEHGLCRFDGKPIYEDIKRNEVQCFYISCAVYWLREYHIDGISVDLSEFKREDCISFSQKLGSAVSTEVPDALLIAYNCEDYKNIERKSKNSPAFSLNIDVDRANDVRFYLEKDAIYRKFHHSSLTCAVEKSKGGRSLLALSHANVALGKRSLLGGMFGSYDEKFANERTFLGYMMTSPGKKLLFMGAEIGQFKEWDAQGETEWFLLGYEKHTQMQRYVCELNTFYLENKALWENDSEREGFEWLDKDSSDLSIVSYKRADKNKNELYVIINFTPVLRKNYKLSASKKATFIEVFNSDNVKYGGGGIANRGEIKPSAPPKSRHFEISVNVPPLSVVILKKIK